MQFTIERKPLSEALSAIAPIAAVRSSLPVLQNVLISANGALTLKASNLETSIVVSLPAEIHKPGETTVNVRTLQEIVATLPASEKVSFHLPRKHSRMTVACAQARFELATIAAKEFPVIQAPGGEQAGVTLALADLKTIAARILFSVCRDNERPTLNSARFHAHDDRLFVTATDGFRISLSETPCSGDLPPILIPLAALRRILALGATVSISPAAGNQVFATSGDICLGANLVEGVYPDVSAVIPTSFAIQVATQRAALLSALRRIEIVARQGHNVCRLDIAPAQITLSGQSEDAGQASETLPADLNGEPLSIAFNASFLREALEACAGDIVCLSFNHPNTPALLTSAGDDAYRHILMPMHLDEPQTSPTK